MSISGIQSIAGSQYSSFSPQKGKATAVEPASSRNTGPDTVTLSTEALRLAGMAGQVEEDATSGEAGTLLGSESQSTAAKPASGIKKSLFSIMLESLLLAELEEAGAGSPQTTSAEDGTMPETEPKKSVNPLKDGEAVAELKKTMNDFMTGKADISDVASAMAVGASGGRQSAAVGKSNAGASVAKQENAASGEQDRAA